MTRGEAAGAEADRAASRGGSFRSCGAILVIGLAVVVAGPLVLDTYSVNILVRSFLYAVAAITVDLLWGYTGILFFGMSAFFAIGAYSAGLAFTHLGFSAWVVAGALIAGMGLSALVALLTGWLSFARGVSPIYASVVSLALPIVATQALFSGGTFTGSSSGLSGFDTFDLSVEAWFAIAAAFLTVVAALGWLFVTSEAGRLLVAIRENEQRCAYLGLRTARIKILLLLSCAVIASVAGFGYASYTAVIAPELAGFVFGTQMVIWVALGGRGTLLGPVIGAILIDFVSAYLSGALPFIWTLIVGIAFVVVIVVMPQGLAPVLAGAGRRFANAWTGKAMASSPAPTIEAMADTGPADRPEGMGSALALTAVSKHFGSLEVLAGIDLSAHPGELLSLVGPNGAGKTTLMRCISDGLERSGGTVAVNGVDIGQGSPERCVALGIGRKFQTATVFESLTVAECLRIARFRLDPPSLWGKAETLRLPQAALKVVEATGLEQALTIRVKHLSHGQKQALELAMVLALEPSVLLLDEPTAGLTKSERTLIGTILVDLTRTQGFCVLLVEHDLDFVREISSRVVVLHQGRIVLDDTVQEVVGSELVRTIYAGETQEPARAFR
ncbi:branched-chain amino acid transport system permease protein [Rhizobiales bacterium GAS113]|nr:branched-chain amino acid transport system permease protein [Rhizobiales bacterium GAS113]